MFYHRRKLVGFLALVLISSVVAAQQASSSHGWRISGKVVDARSGQALARCMVEISPTTERSPSVSMTTGDDGQFVFDGLGLGKYRLTAAKRGYLTQSYEEHENYSTAIAVGPALKSEALIFNLMPQAIFYGVVSDEAGEPVRRAQVRLFEEWEREGIRSIQQRQVAMTDDRGMYEIHNVSPDNHYLAVTAQPWYAHVVALDTGQPGESNSALDVAYATTFYANAIDSAEATPIPVKGGERIEVDMTLTAQRAMHLHLPVAAGENPSVGISQFIFGQLEGVPTGMQSSKDGVMEIEGLVPGRYEVTVTRDADHAQLESTHFTTDLAGGATELSENSAAEEVTVTGRVTSLQGKMPPASIALLSAHPRQDYSATVNPAGEFTLRVPAGEYEVVGRIPQMYLARVSSPNSPVKGRVLEVKAGTAPKLEIVAGAGYGQIDGWAEAGGQRVGGVMILLAPEDAKDNHILFRRDQSDSDGTFSLFNVVPGRYRLMAIDRGWDLEWTDPNVLDSFMKKSFPIQIRANEKLKQVVEVQMR
jgi:hypothetical protein